MTRATRPITGTHLFQRERCRRFVWLEFHGDAAAKLPPDDATQWRLGCGRLHEQEIIKTMEVVEPEYPARDFKKGAEATLAIMKRGAPRIYQGVLYDNGRVGLPDLLERIEGTHQYRVGDVKASETARMEHAMQISYYTDLLRTTAPTHAPRDPVAFLVLSSGRREDVRLDDLDTYYKKALADVEAMRRGTVEPQPALRPACRGCAWRGVCIPAMQQNQDLTLVHGVTPARREALREAGIPNYSELAACAPEIVASRTDLPIETVRKLKTQAAALVDNTPRKLGAFSIKKARIALTAAVARDPRGTHYAEFFAFRTCIIHERLQEQWIHECASTPAAEENAYRKFIRAVSGDLDAPIYHYGSSLPDALASLDSRYGKLNDPTARIFERLVDVQAAIRSSLILPIFHYDLSSVCESLGVTIAPDSPTPAMNSGAALEELNLLLRRRVAAEVKAVRAARVAAARAWSQGAAIASATDASARAHATPEVP